MRTSVEKLAEALSMLGLHRALVVHGSDGLDEITITGPTRVAELRDGQVHTYEVTPEEFGLQRATLDEISGGDATRNASLIREVLEGKKSARRDVVLLNAAAALVAAGRADHMLMRPAGCGRRRFLSLLRASLKRFLSFT